MREKYVSLGYEEGDKAYADITLSLLFVNQQAIEERETRDGEHKSLLESITLAITVPEMS